MKNTLLKYLGILALIILACVVLARTLTSSQTVADYAKANPSLQKDEVVVPEIEEVVEVKQDEPKEAIEDVVTEPVEDESLQDKVIDVESSFYIEEIDDELKAYMRGKSYADNIDEDLVNFDMLRHVVILYNDFEGNTVDGEIVCSELIADDILDIFKKLYDGGYQLEEVSLVDKYDADDDASMEADNTSCFNYRVVDNTTKLSYHAYGLAIDVNPFYNPYVQFRNGADYICPEASEPYADRDAEFAYKIDENDLAYKLFTEHGFNWGGNWNSCKDYQHFEKRLR